MMIPKPFELLYHSNTENRSMVSEQVSFLKSLAQEGRVLLRGDTCLMNRPGTSRGNES